MITAPVTAVPSVEEYNRLLALVTKLTEAKAKSQKITFKIGEKGGVSAYGLGRFPVTLYAGQWERLLAEADNLKAFMAANKSKLATKPE